MQQARKCNSFANHDTHTNSSGFHAVSSQLSGKGHGDYVDDKFNY